MERAGAQGGKDKEAGLLATRGASLGATSKVAGRGRDSSWGGEARSWAGEGGANEVCGGGRGAGVEV